MHSLPLSHSLSLSIYIYIYGKRERERGKAVANTHTVTDTNLKTVIKKYRDCIIFCNFLKFKSKLVYNSAYHALIFARHKNS